MNAGFINRINAKIAEIKAELTQGRAGHPDATISPERENELLDLLGTLVELLQQFNE